MPRTAKWILVFLSTLVLLIGLACAAAFLGTIGNYAVAPTVDDDPDLPYIEVHGYQFHGETFGNPESPVVIVLHGGPGNDYRMLLSLKALKDQYFVVFYDQRGAGLSPRVPADQLTMDQYVQDLDGMVDYFAGDRAAMLVGHSFGAMLASAYIGKHPEKVGGAVLAEPGFLTSKMADQLMERTNGMQPESLHAKEFWWLGKTFFQSLHVKSVDGDEQMDWFVQQMARLPIDKHPLKRYFCGGNMKTAYMPEWRFGSTVSRTMLGSIRDSDGNIHAEFADGVECYDGEVLFIASACNSLIGEEVQREHMTLFQNPALVVIPYSGHTMFGEQPTRTLQVVRDYLQRVEKR